MKTHIIKYTLLLILTATPLLLTQAQVNLDKYNLIENQASETPQQTCGANQSLNPYIGVCTCNTGFIMDNQQCLALSQSQTNTVSPNYREDNAKPQINTPQNTTNQTNILTNTIKAQSLDTTQVTRAIASQIKNLSLKRVWNDSNRGYLPVVNGQCAENQVIHQDLNICICDTQHIMINNQCVSQSAQEQNNQNLVLKAYARKARKIGVPRR